MSEPVFSTKGLVTWLSKQDPSATYNYNRTDRCMLAQYLGHHGFTDIDVSFDDLSAKDASGCSIRRPLPAEWDRISHGDARFSVEALAEEEKMEAAA